MPRGNIRLLLCDKGQTRKRQKPSTTERMNGPSGLVVVICFSTLFSSVTYILSPHFVASGPFLSLFFLSCSPGQHSHELSGIGTLPERASQPLTCHFWCQPILLWPNWFLIFPIRASSFIDQGSFKGFGSNILIKTGKDLARLMIRISMLFTNLIRFFSLFILPVFGCADK